jgi:deoxyribonuclease V
LPLLPNQEAIKSMQIKKLHGWNLTYAQARELQTQLAGNVQFTPLTKTPRLIAGLDCALLARAKRIVAAAVVLEVPQLTDALRGPIEPRKFRLVETAVASQALDFPYIPGLLSFRESPVCLAAVEKLQTEPDAFMIDGQGIAHPRRFGLAAHLGLFFDRPTIGCAKSRLTGRFEEPPDEKGAYSLLKDQKRTDEVIGAVLRTRTRVKPVFVSVGNRCTLENAVKLVLDCTTKYRLPEPTRLAHQHVSKMKWKV